MPFDKAISKWTQPIFVWICNEFLTYGSLEAKLSKAQWCSPFRNAWKLKLKPVWIIYLLFTQITTKSLVICVFSCFFRLGWFSYLVGWDQMIMDKRGDSLSHGQNPKLHYYPTLILSSCWNLWNLILKLNTKNNTKVDFQLKPK